MKKLLLHVCCGPCVIAIFEELKKQFVVTAYYYNPNIHPKDEYEKRRDVVKELCKEMNMAFIEGEYDANDWLEWAQEYKDEKEGGQRCEKCFQMRLERTAKYASEDNFEYFASTLTSGRNKKADVINPLGSEVGEKYGVKFYEEDWKKKGRQEKSSCLCKEKDIYRQHYCGCSYSMNSS